MSAPRITMAIIAMALAAVACNATGATPTPPGATPRPVITAAPVVAAPAALRGSWTADVQGTTASSGLWTMMISESNLLLQNPASGDLFSLGPIAISETALVLAADPDCEGQAAPVTDGTYSLALAGDTLTVTLVSDSCRDRSGVLTAAPWTRTP